MLTVAIFLEKITLFSDKPICFFKKTQILNVFRIFNMSIVIFGKFAELSDRKKIQNFLDNPIKFLLKKNPNFDSFEKFFFQSHSTANMEILAFFFKNSQFFSKNRFNFFKKSQFLAVLIFFTISVAFYGKFYTFKGLIRNSNCFRKTHLLL